MSFATISTDSPLASTIAAAPSWAASFSRRAERVDVVREPRQEEERAAGEDPDSSVCRFDRPHGDRDQHARGEAREDADAAEGRRRALVPALPGRLGDESLVEARA